MLYTVLNRAIKWKANGVSRMAMNPMAPIEKWAGTKKKFETRIEEPAEQALIAACEQLNWPQHMPHSRLLTWELVNALRERVAAGEQQSKAAAEYRISRGLCRQIVKGEIWNPSKSRMGTKGDEMRRRVYAAFDLG